MRLETPANAPDPMLLDVIDEAAVKDVSAEQLWKALYPIAVRAGPENAASAEQLWNALLPIVVKVGLENAISPEQDWNA